MTGESPIDRRWKTPVVPFLIGPSAAAIEPDVLSRLAGCYVPDIADVVGRMYTVQHIRSIFDPALPVVGTALTVKCPPGDNLAVKKALTLTRPGDVLVIDAQGFTEWCLGGFQMLKRAISDRGLRGVIVHGAYRDASEAQQARFPIYALGTSTWSGPKLGPGEINVPVCCGGVIVHPGDVVCASADGIAVVPRAYARAVIDRLGSGPRAAAGQPAGAAGVTDQDAALDRYFDEMEKHGLLVSSRSPAS
jgi:regulator of RNase E activity RraA